jgi:hypothetical protein
MPDGVNEIQPHLREPVCGDKRRPRCGGRLYCELIEAFQDRCLRAPENAVSHVSLLSRGHQVDPEMRFKEACLRAPDDRAPDDFVHVPIRAHEPLCARGGSASGGPTSPDDRVSHVLPHSPYARWPEIREGVNCANQPAIPADILGSPCGSPPPGRPIGHALNEFAERYYAAVRAFIAAVTRSPADAEDLTQRFSKP